VIQALAANCRSEQALTELEEDLNSLNKDGWSPLHLCCLSGSGVGQMRAIKSLLNERAHVDALDSRGETPLMVAVQHSVDALICTFLLDSNANLFSKNSRGETALDLAQNQNGVPKDVVDTLTEYASKEWWRQAECHVLCSGPGQPGPDAQAPQLHLPIPPLSGALPRVSMICPTVPSRSRFHQQIYDCFLQQTYPYKELVVIETGPSPSRFFSSGPASKDTQVVYKWRKDADRYDPERPENGHGAFSVGSKRNIAIEAATGEIIAHFDDDDFYGPCYLEQMVSAILKHGAHMVKLSSFFVFDCETGRLGYCDPEAERRGKEDLSVDEFVFGYGFSYVYRRSLALKWPFPCVPFGEDHAFLLALQEKCYSICLLPDLDGICLHMQHGRNSSLAFCSDSVPRYMLHAMEVSGCKNLEKALEKWPERAAVDQDAASAVIPGGERLRGQRSAMLGLALQVLDRRACLVARGALGGGLPPGGVGTRVMEARALLGNRVLDDVSPAALVRRELRLELLDKMGKSSYIVMVPWRATVNEAQLLALEALDAKVGSRLLFRDAERTLSGQQMLLGRRYLRFDFE